MRSFSTLVLVQVISAMFCFASPALADAVFQDGFESYAGDSTFYPFHGDYDPGTPPITGTSWSVAETNAAYVRVLHNATDNYAPGPASGENYLNLHENNSAAAAKFSENGRIAIEAAKNLTISTMAYKNSLDGWGGSITLAAFDSTNYTNQAFSVSLMDDGTVQYWANSQYTLIPGLTSVNDAWQNLVVEMDFNSHTFDVSLTNSVHETQTATGIAMQATSISKVQGIWLISDTAAGRGAFDDIVAFTTVPEPTVLMMLTTGLFGLVAYACRKRR